MSSVADLKQLYKKDKKRKTLGLLSIFIFIIVAVVVSISFGAGSPGFSEAANVVLSNFFLS